MHKDIDTSILRAFVAVAETGSVTAAARLLNRTQAAVSQQIKRLEQHFGATLFEREHKRIALAPEGERLLGPAQKLLSLNDATWGMMTTPDFEGEVRLGLPADLVARYAPSILRRFNAAWPQVRVSIETGNSNDLVAALDRNELDLCLSTDQRTDRTCETLYQDRLVWIGSPQTSAHLKRPLPITIGGPKCRFRPATLEALTEAGIEWRTVIEIINHEAMCAPVSAGLAVTALLIDSVPNNLKIIDQDQGLPQLPPFDINLHLPRSG
ncbi:MAG: LysR family transcriptional regulator, partial [Alphaproteobacteria bacterium]|nr:LysR family transcriptional regulator [Alphaproteobacteria bacterium]